MKELKIEWKHYDKEGETCTRCNSTGNNIQKAIKVISRDSRFDKAKITFKETKLRAEEMPESNSVFINGEAIEDILRATASENYCHSCSCLAGAGTNCRTIELNGKSFEDIPENLILQAIIKSLE